MTEYISARLYRKNELGAWPPPTLGSAEELKGAVRGLVEQLGQPISHSFVESREADVVRIKWDRGEEIRLVLDKTQNYELIHCPSCGRPMLPPSHRGFQVECVHTWVAEWQYDAAENIWRCNELHREA